MSARWEPTSGSNPARGQALVELAVFGSLLLFLIGYLVSSALQYDHRQQVKMEAFRRALASAAGTTDPNGPISTSHVVIQDRRIPDPSDPFGVGSPSPVIGQAGVTRKFNLQSVPDDNQSLPRMAVQVENAAGCPGGTRVAPDASGNPLTCYFTTAGLRTESGVGANSLDRYKLVYDDVCTDGAKCPGAGQSGCAGPPGDASDLNPNTGLPDDGTTCAEPLYTAVILDSCEGEIIDYDDCLRQAAIIVDSGMCEAACAKGGKAAASCQATCSEPIQPPWYAAGASCGGGRCTAPVLDGLFLGAGIANMGVQPGSLVVIKKDNVIQKAETPGGVTSTMAVDVAETTTRDVRWVGGSGTITSKHTDQATTTWSTGW